MTLRPLFRLSAISAIILLSGCATLFSSPTGGKQGQSQTSQTTAAKPAACACKARQTEE